MPVWLWIVIALIIIVHLVMGYRFFNFALSKDSKIFSGDNNKSAWGKYQEQHDRDAAWLKAQPFEEVDILSGDGLKLHGHYYKNERAKRAVLCVHGYHGTWFGDFCSSAPWLIKDCSLLLIDQRCCEGSEGQYYTFGAMESDDVMLWTAWLDKMTGKKLPIYLYGISLGSSTVLTCSDRKLPSSVKGIIGDCGYSSMEDIFASLSWRWFHIPGYPLVWFVALWCRLIGHFSMFKANAKKALKHAAVPVLLIHGKADDFVLPKNSQVNYDACTSKKNLVWIDDATHAVAHNADPAKYEEAVEKFFAECEN